MSTFPTTDAQLIAALADGDQQEAWYEFERLYSPALLRVLRNFGIRAADAEDCCQRVLVKLIKAAADFENDGRPGSFRRWLYRVARNESISYLRSIHRFPLNRSDLEWQQAAGDKRLESELGVVMPDLWQLEKSLEVEYRKQAFLAAAEQVRGEVNPKHWQAFWRTMVEQEPTHVVARELGMSVGAVYVTKGRILKQLQKVVKVWEDQE